MADPWLSSSVTIPADRCGPPGMGNGGWVSGTVAPHLGRGPVEVTLHAPTPLDVPLGLRAADDDASLDDAGRVLVTARRVAATPAPPAAVTWDEAVVAGQAFAGHHEHPFPGCFACGTDRGEGHGLRLFAGPVAGPPGTVATAFTSHPAHTLDGRRLPPAGVWALPGCLGRLRPREGGGARAADGRGDGPGRGRAALRRGRPQDRRRGPSPAQPGRRPRRRRRPCRGHRPRHLGAPRQPGQSPPPRLSCGCGRCGATSARSSRPRSSGHQQAAEPGRRQAHPTQAQQGQVGRP